MTTPGAPMPLGWCAWHLGSDEKREAITVYNGAALCAECHQELMAQAEDGEEEEPISES